MLTVYLCKIVCVMVIECYIVLANPRDVTGTDGAVAHLFTRLLET